jgi:hypothetical protein
MRRVDPIAMPVVTAPAAPTGTRDVTLDKAGQSVGAPATLRNLTLTGGAGSVAVPAGVYGSFAINGSASLVLGEAGATEPAVYGLQSLTLGRNATVKIVGPVRLKLATGSSLDGVIGSVDHPEWLECEIATGGLTLNGNAAIHGVVIAPNSSLIINGSIHGRISADQLAINGSGVLSDPGL